MSLNKAVVFGDEIGIDVIMNSLPGLEVAAVVHSATRPEARSWAGYWAGRKNCLLVSHEPGAQGTQDLAETLAALRPTVGLCNSYDRIIAGSVLALFPQGIFNVHPALLPKYRGANVINWVLVNGETETGVTMHKMVEAVDAGPILVQHRVSIDFADTALSLREKIAACTRTVLAEGWSALLSGRYTLSPQDESQAFSCRRRNPDDGMFDWNQPAIGIYNLIRALVSPWPGAWYKENGRRVILDKFYSFADVKKLQQEKTGHVIQ